MITASALTRLRNCPSSAVLPRAENHSEWADLGHEAHEELAIFSPDHPFAHLIPANARAEVKLAYDVATRAGRIIGEGSGRDYGSPGPFEIVGSCDVLGVEADRVIVIDWKSGFADVEPAATNAQLWFYALAACRALGRSSATIRIVYTQTRRIDEHEIDALDLAEFATSLERLHTQVAERHAARKRGEIVDTHEGAWCKWCPARPHCPSKHALLVQVAEKGLAVLGDATMTPERARAGYEQLVLLEQLVRDARKRLEVYVDENGPIDLGGGRFFGRYVRNGNERLDGDVAVRAIAEVVGESAREFEAAAIERRTSKAAIERAAKSLGCPRGTASRVIARIRELGGTSRGADTMPLGEYMADKHEPAPKLDVGAVNRALQEAE